MSRENPLVPGPYGWFAVALLVFSVASLLRTSLLPLFSGSHSISTLVVVHGLVFIGWYPDAACGRQAAQERALPWRVV